MVSTCSDTGSLVCMGVACASLPARVGSTQFCSAAPPWDGLVGPSPSYPRPRRSCRVEVRGRTNSRHTSSEGDLLRASRSETRHPKTTLQRRLTSGANHHVKRACASPKADTKGGACDFASVPSQDLFVLSQRLCAF